MPSKTFRSDRELKFCIARRVHADGINAEASAWLHGKRVCLSETDPFPHR
jgi:hypothetical protein